MRVLARFGYAPLFALVATAALAEPPLVSPFGAPKLPPLSATSKNLIAEANAIVVGRVVSIQSGRVDGEIARLARFEISESMKGDVSGAIEIVLPGGVDPDIKLMGEVAHDTVPPFAVDEEAVVFLVAFSGRDRSYAVAGGLGGKIQLRRGVSGGLRAARLLDSRGDAPLDRLREQIQLGISGSAKSLESNGGGVPQIENTTSNSQGGEKRTAMRQGEKHDG